ncbi:EF-hand domain-containing family member [Echinococcus granulosus]|uniref:EF-hand domain-containing family member n=1 Tax=Echinococcus granulosus TaxID=6210 RepID=W6U165_ECHGR|nr:EF-hand domain-containing family member [Echinococcus granulosus]EUB54855.1 EF-hand domain-containing family member [Echinococcus granulosus]
MKMYFKNVFFVLSATVSTVGYFGAKRLLCSTVLWQTDQWGCNSSKYDQHFRLFASREYCGVLYMTPNDFLQSLFQEKPPTSQLNSLSPDEVKTILQKAGHCGSKNLFRKLGNQGLISFTDYLFLLGLLNKPSSRYEVAFDILDTDYSGAIDANEFSMLYGVSAGAPDQMQLTHDRLSLGNLSDQSTLMRVFFGKDGKQLLKKEDFYKFIENFQNEILEAEFTLSSPNGATISPTNFARVLLHNTDLPESRYDEFLSRLRRLPANVEITLEDFKRFYKFVNHLDDFQMAMKMYMLANRPISLTEFKRAIRACVNLEIGEQALQTLFCMFDADGDGHMSPQEFMVLLRNRRPRGIHKNADFNRGIWKDYKKCLSRAIREQ